MGAAGANWLLMEWLGLSEYSRPEVQPPSVHGSIVVPDLRGRTEAPGAEPRDRACGPSGCGNDKGQKLPQNTRGRQSRLRRARTRAGEDSREEASDGI